MRCFFKRVRVVLKFVDSDPIMAVFGSYNGWQNVISSLFSRFCDGCKVPVTSLSVQL